MSDAWNGVPPGEWAERDGWHWVLVTGWADKPIARFWNVKVRAWGALHFASPENVRSFWRYVAPCLPPADLAAAVLAEREACAARCDALVAFGDAFEGREGTSKAWARAAESLATAIRSRPAPAGADALAERERAARIAAWEGAAALVDCGCPAVVKDAVLAVRPNSAARWNACGSSTCGAIEAAAIRALKETGDAQG